MKVAMRNLSADETGGFCERRCCQNQNQATHRYKAFNPALRKSLPIGELPLQLLHGFLNLFDQLQMMHELIIMKTDVTHDPAEDFLEGEVNLWIDIDGLG